MQAVTHNLALGGEVAYQYGPGIPGGGIAVISGVGKYSGNVLVTTCHRSHFMVRPIQAGANWNLSGTVGGAGLHLGFYQKASEQVQIGVELETNVRMQESVASIGYQVVSFLIHVYFIFLNFLLKSGGIAESKFDVPWHGRLKLDSWWNY